MSKILHSDTLTQYIHKFSQEDLFDFLKEFTTLHHGLDFPNHNSEKVSDSVKFIVGLLREELVVTRKKKEWGSMGGRSTQEKRRQFGMSQFNTPVPQKDSPFSEGITESGSTGVSERQTQTDTTSDPYDGLPSGIDDSFGEGGILLTEEEFCNKWLPSYYDQPESERLAYAIIERDNYIEAIKERELKAKELSEAIEEEGYQKCPFLFDGIPEYPREEWIDIPEGFDKHYPDFWDTVAKIKHGDLSRYLEQIPFTVRAGEVISDIVDMKY